MKLNQTTISVSDVSQTSEQLSFLFGIQSDYADEQFAQFTIGQHCLMVVQAESGLISRLILHLQVDDVESEFSRLAAQSASIIREPVMTDWGTYSFLVQVSEGLVFDIYQLATNH